MTASARSDFFIKVLSGRMYARCNIKSVGRGGPLSRRVQLIDLIHDLENHCQSPDQFLGALIRPSESTIPFAAREQQMKKFPQRIPTWNSNAFSAWKRARAARKVSVFHNKETV